MGLNFISISGIFSAREEKQIKFEVEILEARFVASGLHVKLK